MNDRNEPQLGDFLRRYGVRDLVRTLGHADTIRSVSFLADGRLLASKGRDGSVRLWDCGAWTPAGVIAEPGKGVWSPRLAFHPGAARLLVAH